MAIDKLSTTFSINDLAASLRAVGGAIENKRFVCALSGGRDSMVLLDAMCQLNLSVRAVHVNHGMQAVSTDFEQHCKQACDARDVELKVYALEHETQITNNVEERLRDLRRNCFARALKPGEILLTAHHQDDQLETFFLQLMRGAGPRGLQGMPRQQTEFASGYLMRPLLGFSREQLSNYAIAHQLNWVEDPSNSDERFSRNFLRSQVLPLLWSHFPGGAKAAMRSIDLQQDAQQRLDQQAAEEAQILAGGWQLEWQKTAGLPRERQAGVLRYWLHTLGVRAPSHARLSEAIRQFAQADAERAPLLVWDGGVIQRYREHLVYLSSAAEPPKNWSGSLQPGQWLALPADGGQLGLFDNEHEPAQTASENLLVNHKGTSEAQVVAHELSLDYVPSEPLSVRFRQEGERVLKPDGHHQSLKQWCQERQLAPVLRSRLPLVLRNREVIAIAGRWTAHVFGKKSASSRWRLVWRETP